MESSQLDLLKELLGARRVLALSVLVDREPAIGLLPFAFMPDPCALVVHASRLARHSRGLQEGAAFEALIHLPDAPEVDPLQIPRVMLRGIVRALRNEGPESEAARRTYLKKIPGAEALLGFGDFQFYRLEIQRGRLVAGFAQAVSFTPETLRRIPQ
jgi:hypothetical protein